MTGLLGYNKMRVFDYAQWAEPLRNQLRNNAEQIDAQAGLEIEFIRNHKAFRKEDRIEEILAVRGELPGLVHIFSAMESCASYRARRLMKLFVSLFEILGIGSLCVSEVRLLFVIGDNASISVSENFTVQSS